MDAPTILRAGLWLAAMIGVGIGGTVSAQEFAALVSPPRYELVVEPGQVSRQVLEIITHMGTQTTPYRIFTADCTLAPDGSVSFSNRCNRGVAALGSLWNAGSYRFQRRRNGDFASRSRCLRMPPPASAASQ